jgi:hypothetical protein
MRGLTRRGEKDKKKNVWIDNELCRKDPKNIWQQG